MQGIPLLHFETFKYCAPVAGSLGFSIEETAENIGLMGNAGVQASMAGTGLKTIYFSVL